MRVHFWIRASERAVRWGVCLPDTAQSLLHRLEKVHVPLILGAADPHAPSATGELSAADKKDLTTTTHRLMAALAERIGKTAGQTLLYAPPILDGGTPESVIAASKDGLQEMEAVAVRWIGRLSKSVSDSEQGLSTRTPT